MSTTASRLNRLPAAERGITIGDFLVPIGIGERISTRARHLALIVAGALLIALSANVSIPVPGTPVPISGQTFSVLLVGGALGARRGILAATLYLILGLFLPVYAEHKQGIAIIMISSEFPELLAMCDRMVCICEGRVTATLDHNEASLEGLMHYCTLREHALVKTE